MSERRYYRADDLFHTWDPYLEPNMGRWRLAFVYKEKITFFGDRIIKKWVDGMYFYAEITDCQAVFHEFFSGDPVGACPIDAIGSCSSPCTVRHIALSNIPPYGAFSLCEISATEFMDAVKPYMKDRELIASEFRRRIAQKKYEDSCKPAAEAAKEAAKRKKEHDAAKFLDDIIGH